MMVFLSLSVTAVLALLCQPHPVHSTAGKATYYGGNVNGNACGFNSMGTASFPFGYGAAIGASNFNSGYGCGGCYTVTCLGPYSTNPSCFCHPDHPTVTVWANDQCPECEDTHIDLNTEAMEYIVGDGLAGTCGVISIEFEQVNCDFASNIQIRAKSGTSAFWYGLHVDDVAGYGAISSVSLAESGNTHPCAKSEGASFWKCDLVTTPLSLPMDVTLVDQGGRSIACTGCITNFDGGAEFDFGSNFATASIPSSTPGTPTDSSPTAPTDSSPTSPTESPPTASAPTGSPSSCFSERATVDVLGKGKVAMKDLNIHDWVATAADEVYQPIYAMAHFDTDTGVEYLQISISSLDNNQQPLEVTPEHLVFVTGQRNPVKAGSLQIGASLQTPYHNSSATVDDIALVYRRGLYAPLTPHGTIIVDGIVASNYAVLQANTNSEDVQVGGIRLTSLTQDQVYHMALSPLRMWCTWLQAEGCKTISPHGYHPYVGYAIQFVHWAEQQSAWLQWIVLCFSLIVMGMFYAMEKVFLSNKNNSATTLLFAVAGIGTSYFYNHHRHGKNVFR